MKCVVCKVNEESTSELHMCEECFDYGISNFSVRHMVVMIELSIDRREFPDIEIERMPGFFNYMMEHDPQVRRKMLMREL